MLSNQTMLLVMLKKQHDDTNFEDETEAIFPMLDSTCSSMDTNFFNLGHNSEYSELENVNETTASTTVSEKTRYIYKWAFQRFEKWRIDRQATSIDEKLVLDYFKERSLESKATTLWTLYSMIKPMVKSKYNADISKYTAVVAFLKCLAKAPTKVMRSFTKEEIAKFLLEADDRTYLCMKVVLIIGLFGACRSEDLVNLHVEDVNDQQVFIEVAIKTDDIKHSRTFVITPGNIPGINLVEIVQKYASLRPSNADHQRFFIQYIRGKCMKQPIGRNTFGTFPKKIAEFLKLPAASEFTGHCFRRSSGLLLGNKWRCVPL